MGLQRLLKLRSARAVRARHQAENRHFAETLEQQTLLATFVVTKVNKSSRITRRQRLGPAAVEALDRRILLAAASAVPANVFALFDGTVPSGGATQQVPINLLAGNFKFSLGNTLSIGFAADTSGGSTLSPNLSLRDGAGRLVSPVPPPTTGSKATLYRLAAGNYSVGVAGAGGSSGPFQLRTFLVGDANGDRTVNTTDSLVIGNLLATRGYSAAADANLDGKVAVDDLVLQAANLGGATTVKPLGVTVGLSPSPQHTLPDGTRVTRIASQTVVGLTSAGANVVLDLNGNNFSSGSAVAAVDGIYLIPLALREGTNVITVRATDSFGQRRTGSLRVALDSVAPAVSAALAADTGVSASDGVTADPSVSGAVTDVVGASSLRAGFDSAVPSAFRDVSASLAPGGSFLLTRAALQQVFGGSITEGGHTLHLQATDFAGNVSSVTRVSFTLDTAAPAAPALGLEPASDTPPVGDRATTAAAVVLVGVTEPGSAVRLISGSTVLGTATAASDGRVSFAGVPLAVGDNVFIAAATDAAGNESQFTTIVTRLGAAAPVVTARLLHDTGDSAADGITSDPAVIGAVTAGAPVTGFAAGFDAQSASAFVDVLGHLAADGTFTLTATDVFNINGGAPLADGAHTLHVVATDAAGRTTTLDLAFTLDTSLSPAPGFALADGGYRTSDTAVTLAGVTEAGARVTLSTGAVVTAAADGTFKFVNVTLASGPNLFVVTATDVAGNNVQSNRVIFRVSPVQSGGEVAVEWNSAALAAVQAAASTPEYASRALAMVSAAMYDAANSVASSSGTLFVRIPAPAGASDVAAVAQAAHDALAYLYPDQKQTFAHLLSTQLSAIADPQSTATGTATGHQVAAAIVAMRHNDGSLGYVNYVPSNVPGGWRPTFPAYFPAENPQWATTTPFLLTSPGQFRPAGPPSLASAEWQSDYEQVRTLGYATSTARTPDQTLAARFWNDPTGTATPPGHWNMIAAQLAGQRNLNLADATRLFAQLNVAMADAAIATWDAKYAYDFWRPITAINAGGGNTALAADPAWRPLLTTPPFPEYTSGHSTFSAAAATVLGATFGPNTSFTIDTTSPAVPSGTTRTFASFDAAAAEAAMSRIYGGIHFNASVRDGLTVGRQIGLYTLQRFTDTTDTAAPVVTYDGPPGRSSTDAFDITGLATDNLSGVSLTARFDNDGSFSVAVDPSGRFTVSTALPASAADGPHVLHLTATDGAGNTSVPFDYVFTFDRAAPTISLTAPPSNTTLALDSKLTGAASGTGSPITALAYHFDGGGPTPLTFDGAGAFDQYLDLTSLSPGTHALHVTATDAAGNNVTTSVNVTLPSLAPTILGITPQDGSTEVGSTFRPKMVFSRAINPATLTSDSFFLTDTTGAKLAAAVVVSDDRTYAYLFPSAPLPGASTVTVTVDGKKIRSPDGAFVDAAFDQSPAGSVLTWRFTTVSLAAVPGTTLSGTVADPGIDLKPGTKDDVQVGPDGVTGTADDVYRLPLAGVTVSILGTTLSTVTDSAGRFFFPAVPAGTVKLDLDGNTAANAPAGFYFPSMVMDLHMNPGAANTVMAAMQANGMGNAPPGAPAPTAPGVYLPRLLASILTPIAPTGVTTLGLEPGSAPDLTDQRREVLALEVTAGSAVGPDGQRLGSFRVGVSAVPPQLVTDMLPPGVMQHTFDITVQAPGVATFATPLPLTVPNIFGAAPGTKLDFLSFDHTTGRLVIEGTATVSADGLTARTDPGTGITHPGWHGVTPPGVCAGSGGPPPTPQPPPKPTDFVITHQPEMLETATGDADFFDQPLPEKVFKAPSAPKKPQRPPAPGCDAPPPRPDDSPQSLTVEITMDRRIDDFLKPGGDLKLEDQTFTLTAGSDEQRILSGEKKSYTEMFGNLGLRALTQGRLYASTVQIKETTVKADGSRVIESWTYYVGRFVDTYDDTPDKTMSFPDTLEDGGNTLPLLVIAPKGYAVATDGPFASIEAHHISDVTFSPTGTGRVVGLFGVKAPDGNFMAMINLAGVGVPRQKWYLNTAGLLTELRDTFGRMDETEKPYFGILNVGDPSTPADNHWEFYAPQAMTFINDALAVAEGKLAAYATGLVRVNTPDSDTVLIDSFFGGPNVPNKVIGRASEVDYTHDGTNSLLNLIAHRQDYAPFQQTYILSQALNNANAGTIAVFLDKFFLDSPWQYSQLVNAMGHTFAHELGHQIGLTHTNKFDDSDLDTMTQGYDLTNLTTFKFTDPAMRVGLGMVITPDIGRKAMDYYYEYFVKGGGNTKTPDVDDPNSEPAERIDSGILSVFVAPGTTASSIDFGTDVPGGAGVTRDLTLTNVGDKPLTLGAARFVGGDGQFTLSGLPIGQVLAPRASVTVAARFAAAALGDAAAQLEFSSTGLDPTTTVQLAGRGLDAAARAVVTALDNNLGGTAVGAAARAADEVATVTNFGATPMTLTAIRLTEGTSSFTLTGLPALPLMLAPGETFTFGATFVADHIGLHRGAVEISTDSTSTPTVTVGLAGTGVATTPVAQWGNDFVAVSTRTNLGTNTIRVRSNAAGNFNMFLPPSTPYEITIFDPDTGLVANGVGKTAPSGGTTDLTRTLVFRAGAAPDTDGDGLPDDVERVVGTSTSLTDTDRDGLSDFAEIDQGLDPFGGRSVPTGVVAALPLLGQAREVVLAGTGTGGGGQLAYVATGAYGLAVVDASKFQQPQVLGQLDLPGTASDVAVDSALGIAAVSAGSGGLHFVNVSNPAAPLLIQTIAGSFDQVEVIDGVAYATNNLGRLVAYDLLTGDKLDELTLGPSPMRGLAREGSFLYTLTPLGLLTAVQVGGGQMTRHGSLATGAGSRLFVGGAVAYVASGSGFATANVSNPDDLRLLSGPDTNNLAAQRVVANGSGLAVAVGSLAGPNNVFLALDVINVSDLTNTAGFVTRVNLPAAPESVAIGSGIAFVADGTGGLIVVNYVPFDTQGLAPSVTISTATADLDLAAPGVQVLEGTTIDVSTLISDDVQVRNVELLVNGRVVSNDVSFPFELAAVALGEGAPVTRIQVRATDTGGNSALSSELVFALLPDVTAPTVSLTPLDGTVTEAGLRRVTVTFSESMHPGGLVPANFTLVAAGEDGQFGTPDDAPVPFQFQTRERGRVVPLTFAALGAGRYRVTVNAAALTDRAGNPLAGAGFSSTFTLVARAEPFEVVGFEPHVGVGLFPEAIAAGDLDGDGDVDIVTANAEANARSVTVLLSDGRGGYARADYAVGGSPRAVALGDVDRDGDLDVVAANYSGSNLAVLTNDGTGGFGSLQNLALPSNGSSVALGDIDRDGDVDAVVGMKNGSSGVSVFRNNGAGVLGSRTDFATGFNSRTESVVLGDLEGDGDLDIVGTLNGVSIWRNNGAGTFAQPTVLNTAASPRAIALGDIDADGDLDLATSHAQGGFMSVLRNNGATFARTDLAVEGATSGVALRDLDGDNDLDLALVGSSGGAPTTWVFRNTAGAFAAQRAYSPAGTDGLRGLAVADLDLDGDLDLAVIGPNPSAVTIVRNDGSGGFGTPVITAGFQTSDVERGDMDGDGDLDLVTASFFGNFVSVLLNTGDPHAPVRADFAVGNRPLSLALADVDGDGDLDVVTANSTVNTITVLRNNGAGALGSRADFATASRPVFVALADVDRDGDVDALTANTTTANVSVLLNNGAGAFASRTDVAGIQSNSTLALGDVDRDGDVDLVVGTENGSSSPALLFNNGAGGFTTRQGLSSGSGSRSLVLGDVDGDADLDFLATSTYAGNSIVVIRNDGTGNLASGQRDIFRITNRPQAIALGDVDGDNDADLVMAIPLDDKISVLANDGAGLFGTQTGVIGDYVATPLGYATGRSPRTLVLGDFDADSDLDVATADYFGNSVSLLTNDGAARFGRPLFAVGLGTRTITSGDLNGDGHLDLVATDATSRSMTVLFGDGHGAFGGRFTFGDGNVTTDADLGDVDGDGDLDIVLSSYVGGNVGSDLWALLNDGSGHFQPVQLFEGGFRPQAVALGDVNGDGNLDIVSANNDIITGAGLSVLLGRGDGTFDLPADYVLSAVPLSVSLGDIDGDGDLDAVFPNGTANTASVLPNDGEGRFGSPRLRLGPIPIAAAVAAGDVDGDGDLDLVNASNQTRTVTLLRNHGTSDFVPETIDGVAGTSTVALGDVDADGDLDLLTAHTYFNQISVLLNDGTGAFGPAANFDVGTRPHLIALRDIDGDGDTDLVSANRDAGSVSVLKNDGTGAFGSRTDYPTGLDPAYLELSDVDGDGDPDLLLPSPTAVSVAVLTNDGTGAFGAPRNIGVGPAPRDIATGDVDGDGDQDLVIANATGNGASLLLNDSAGQFGPRTDFVLAASPAQVSLADVDGDGDLDIIAGDTAQQAVLRNDGTGRFSPREELPVGTALGPPKFADMDGDGDLDFIAPSAGLVAVLYNPGNGAFGAHPLYSTGTNAQAAVLADVNGDGAPDLLALNSGSSTVSVLLNNGSGAFAGRLDFGTGITPRSIAAADVDGDGDSDLVMANFSTGNSIAVLLNDGGGVFLTRLEFIVGPRPPRAVTLGDVDGDGDLDIITASYDDGSVSVLIVV